MSESWNTKLRSFQTRKKNNIKKPALTLKGVYITIAKFHYFHRRKFQDLQLQPLPPNNPNLFTVIYLRFLDDERFYEKILTRQLCKKSLCCLPPNLNKFQVIFEMSEREEKNPKSVD